MSVLWNLDTLYPSFDSEAFTSDLNKVKKLIPQMQDWCKQNLHTTDQAVLKMERYIQLEQEFETVFSRLMDFASLTLSVEAKNETALQMTEKLEQMSTELTESSVLFDKFVGGLPDLSNLISTSSLLQEHRFYLTEIAEQNKYLLSEKEEILLSKLVTTGSSAWSKLQDLLSSVLLVDIEIDGELKQLPLPVVRNMAYEKDSALRKKAYEAELKAYDQIAESSAASLNGIKGEVLTVSKMRGFSSPLEESLIHARLDSEILDAMMTAIKEFLPTFRKYFLKKAQMLSYDGGLPFYELFAPLGKTDVRFTYDEAKKLILKNFNTFSPKLSAYAKRAFDNNWIDAAPREGKRGGAFCANLHCIGESRILMNFTGSFNDVSTLAHELGHGYHGDCLVQESVLNSDYPMPIAETASIFCETIIIHAALKEADSKQALFILENQLSSMGQVIVDIYSRFLFEKELFEHRQEASLSVKELKDIMIWAQKETYGEGLACDALHPYMWVCKPHYYDAAYSFYNYPYSFGELFSKGLYAQYLERGEDFVTQYDTLLASTGKNKIADLTAMMGIDITSVDFWRSSLDIIEKDIEKFLTL